MTKVAVRDEFGELLSAIVHDGGNAVDVTMADYLRLVPPEELAEHPESAPSSSALLVSQHAAFRRLLADEGVSLVSPETQPGAFCQVFARDPCFAIGETLFVGGLRDEWRHPETVGLVGILGAVGRVVDLSGNGANIEGGDVMVLDHGKLVLVGMNRHTNAAGVERLVAALGGSGAEVVVVPHRTLHLDCCLAPLPGGEALYAAAKLPDASVAALAGRFRRLTPLDPEEAALHLAANLFWIDRRRVVSGRASAKANAILREKGYEVIEFDFSQLVSLWGSFRCVVAPLWRE